MNKSAHGTLVANTVTTVSLTEAGWPVAASILVINVSGGTPIYVRMDGTDPAVKGADSRVVIDFRSFASNEDGNANATDVRLISAAAVDYSIEVVR
jgi:hypothetical protein